ncbi:MAG: periplasmic heavy metal sensor [Pseudomonadota bacterium]
MEDVTIQKRCPWWVKILLALSLALNLGIAGMVAGVAISGGPMGGQGPAVGYAMPYLVALPKEQRRAVFKTVRNDKTLPDRRARRADYSDMMTALAAEPFERAAVEAILSRQADGVDRVQSVAQSQWLDLVAEMPAQERADYIERIKEVLERAPKRDKKR